MKKSALLSSIPFFSGIGNRINTIKISLLTLLLCGFGYSGHSAVVVTAASGGTNICSTVATSPTTLGPITITEGLMTDFNTPSGSIILAPPAGWTFVVSLPTVTAAPGGDVSIGVVSISAGSLSINFNEPTTTHLDVVTISNLQIQATTSLSSPGNIIASSDFGVVGITTGVGGTNFGSLSILAALAPAVSISASPAGPICAGTPVTFTPNPVNGGVAPTYSWFVNGSFVGGGSFFSTSTLNNGDLVHVTMTVGGGVCVFPATATSADITMAVNPLPTPVVASGAGTFCGSTSISGANGGSGTIFFQNTTSGGTSTLLGGTPQTVNTSGTYYFRARSGAGCWGTEGSVAVIINPAATANAGLPVSMCAGTTITLAGSIGGSATSSTWSAPSGTFSNVNSLTSTYTPSIVSGTVLLTLTTNDPDGAGPCAAAVSTVLITVNPVPNPVVASGGGTFCGSTSISGANGGSGVIFFQGNTSGGTSIVLGGTPQVVNASGTYYFRANLGGCWGNEGSVAVTINPAATANAGVPQSVCAGGTITLAGSIGGSATTSTWSAPSGSFSNVNSLTSTYTPSILSGTVLLTLTTNDPDGAGPCTAAVSTVLITVNPLPNTPFTFGGGTFCGSTNISAGLIGPGTIYFQGNTSGGTSTVLGGTPQTVNASGTYYFRAQSGLGCWGNEASVTVTINPLPAAYNVTGGGGYCTGGTGVDVGLSFSDAGINYQLFRGALAVGAPQAGTNAALDFGLQTTAGTYTIVATNPATTCTRTMTGNAVVSINALPTAFTLIGGGAYCAGGAGATLFLTGSAVGVNYQLILGGLPVGAPIAGTGFFMNLGSYTAAGVYTCVATNTTTGCTNNMLGSATVTVNPLPFAFSILGGGGYCAGGVGVNISLAGSAVGVSYQLYRGAVTVGAAVAGTGGILSFGNQTVAGTYTIVGTNTTTFCTNTMTGSVTVTINPLPGLFTVTGGGAYCAGGPGVNVGLTGSAVGINYQLLLGGVPVGAAVAGTGFALDFGLETAAGIYTVVATDAVSLCSRNMTGSVTITINAAPAVFTVTGGGGYCSGGTGVVVGLSGSAVGVTYQLYNLFTTVGAPLSGTGAALSFGLQTAGGFYTVVATTLATGCTSNMTGGVAVTILPLPTQYNVTGGGVFCLGGSGVSVGLSSSDVGVNYQLYNGIVPVGTPVAGTGTTLDFGLQTSPGTYTVVATDAFTTCSSPMTGSATVTANPAPNAYALTGGGTICAGSPGVAVGLAGSDVGISYQLYVGGLPTGAPVAGTTGPISFGLQTTAGTYTVIATNMVTLCTSNMTGSILVIVNPAPTAYTVTVTGTGAYCVGGTGVDIGLATSDLGITYQLYRGITPIGAPVAGTGVALDFGMQTVAGVYSVVGTDDITTCTGNMNNTVTVSVIALPTVFTLSGSGTICAGAPGVDMTLSGSQVGVNYQLYIGIVPVGGVVAGTGAVLDMGVQTSAGTYTCVATTVVGGCTSNMMGTGNVIVNPAPTAYTVTGGGTYCTGGTGFHIGLSSSDAGINYQLYNGASPVGGLVAGTGSALDFGLTAVIGTYTVVGTDAGTGCTGNMTGFATIAVSAYPVVDVIAGPASFCQGTTVTLTDDSLGGAWSSANIAIATVDAFGVVTGVSGGVVSISYTVTNGAGCATSVTKSETVLAAPTVPAIVGYPTVCIGQTITLTDATGGGVWSSSDPSIATVSPAGVVSGVALGSVTITYTVTGVTCSTTVVKPITVGDAIPSSALLPVGSATLCGGTPVNLSVVTTGGGTYSYGWFVDGSTIPGAVGSSYTATTPGLYTAYISNGSCQVYFVGTNVLAPPNPVITLDTPAGLLFTGSFVSYQWFLDGTAIPGATSNNIPVGPLGSMYTVVVTDANGCTDTSALFIYGGGPLKVKTNITAGDIKIYPNPTTSVLHIDAPGRVFISVVSPSGQVLIEKKEAISINVGQLADGMYLIMVYDENNALLKTDKFVKMQ